jgi:hypothetical protein
MGVYILDLVTPGAYLHNTMVKSRKQASIFRIKGK